MARLVHIAPERLLRRIERSGLRGREWLIPAPEGTIRVDEAIFAAPSFPDEQITYQWVRELRSWAKGARMVAVTFEIDADTEVFFGRFGKPKERGNHRDAYAAIEKDPWGAEVVACGPIARERILSVRTIRQDIGWQETPERSGHRDCACPVCLPSGHPKLMRRLRAQFNGALERAHASSGDPEVILRSLSDMDDALQRGRGRLSPKRLHSFVQHASPRVRARTANSLRYFRWDEVAEAVHRLVRDPDPDVQEEAMDTAILGGGIGFARTSAGEDPKLLVLLCETMDYATDSNADAMLETLASHQHEDVRTAASETLRSRNE